VSPAFAPFTPSSSHRATSSASDRAIHFADFSRSFAFRIHSNTSGTTGSRALDDEYRLVDGLAAALPEAIDELRLEAAVVERAARGRSTVFLAVDRV